MYKLFTPMSRCYGHTLCKFGSVSFSFSCFLAKTTEMWKNFQGVSKADDKNKDKTVKSVLDPNKASRKCNINRKVNRKW